MYDFKHCIECGKKGGLKRGWTMAMYCSERCEKAGVSALHSTMPGCGSPWMPEYIKREIAARWASA